MTTTTDNEQNNARERMLEAEANYRELFHKANDAIYVHDAATGKVLEVNERACELTGYSRAELLTGSIADHITDHPDHTLEKAIGYITKPAAGEPQRFEWLGKDKAGTHHWYEVNLKKATI